MATNSEQPEQPEQPEQFEPDSTDPSKPEEVGANPLMNQGVKVVLLDTPKQLIAHAKKILYDSKKSEWKDIPIDKKLEVFQDKYKEFGRTFPIVLRHIVQSQKLYSKVFERYILLCKNHPTHSISEFQERQADYLVMIYRQEHPHCSNRELTMVKRKHVKDLKKEEEYMKKVMDEVKQERDEKAKQFDKSRRGDLLGLISRCINDVPTDIDISLEEKNPVENNDDDNNNTTTNASEDADQEESLVFLPVKKEK